MRNEDLPKRLPLLASLAEGILLFDPSHVPSAQALSEALHSCSISDFERMSVAASTSRAFRFEFETQAMHGLRKALVRLAEDADAPWGRSIFSCLNHLLRLTRETTLARCGADLAHGDELTRESLIGRLGEVAGADVLFLLRRHVEHETSPRLRLRLLILLGEFVPDRTRVAILRDALALDAPWWRWQAVQELWRTKPATARELARSQLLNEPDRLLQELLREAVVVSEGLGRRRLRSRQG